jgi:hypothetical protein
VATGIAVTKSREPITLMVPLIWLAANDAQVPIVLKLPPLRTPREGCGPEAARRRPSTVLIPFSAKSERRHNNHQVRDLHFPNPTKHCERT